MEIWKQCDLMARVLDLKSEGSWVLNPLPPLLQDEYVWGGPRFNSSIYLAKWLTAHHPIN